MYQSVTVVVDVVDVVDVVVVVVVVAVAVAVAAVAVAAVAVVAVVAVVVVVVVVVVVSYLTEQEMLRLRLIWSHNVRWSRRDTNTHTHSWYQFVFLLHISCSTIFYDHVLSESCFRVCTWHASNWTAQKIMICPILSLHGPRQCWWHFSGAASLPSLRRVQQAFDAQPVSSAWKCRYQMDEVGFEAILRSNLAFGSGVSINVNRYIRWKLFLHGVLF